MSIVSYLLGRKHGSLVSRVPMLGARLIAKVRSLIQYDERSWIDKELVGKKLEEDSEEVLLRLERVRPCTLEAIRMNDVPAFKSWAGK